MDKTEPRPRRPGHDIICSDINIIDIGSGISFIHKNKFTKTLDLLVKNNYKINWFNILYMYDIDNNLFYDSKSPLRGIYMSSSFGSKQISTLNRKICDVHNSVEWPVQTKMGHSCYHVASLV